MNYIILTNSDVSLSKRFKVLLGGHQIKTSKAQSVGTTIDGEVDVSMGSLQDSHKYSIRVPHAVADVNYGTLSDLKEFFSLNNPAGIPSNIITLTDNFEDVHSVVFIGDFSASLVGVSVEGYEASSIVNCLFKVI